MFRDLSFSATVVLGGSVAFFLLTAPSAHLLAASARIMSYNVLANWDDARGDRLVAVVGSQSPDVLGLQEVVGNNVDYLLEGLAEDYEAFFADKPDPMFVRRGSSLRVVDQGSTEIYRCAIDRHVNWLRIEDIDSGAEFLYYNTHLCFILQNTLDGITNEEANQVQAGQIIDVMVPHARDGLVQVIGGDLNTFSSSNTTRFFVDSIPLPYDGKENPLALKDTWPAAPGNSGRKPSTRGGGNFGGMGQGAGMGMGMATRFQMPDEPGIDWIFVSEFATVLGAQVVRDDLTTNASDHLPVTATIEF
jgi:endonuclease/exonuclease/phosphatase family metal-dependent hydrolase